MSTRANIGIKLDNGTYLMNYCHYDGYPSHVGEILTAYYDTYESATKLLEGNHIRQFKEDGSVERFNDGNAEVYETIEEALKGFDFVYVFVEGWKCYSRASLPLQFPYSFGVKETALYD